MVTIVRNFLIMVKKIAREALKTTSKTAIQKTVAATGDLIGDKIVDKSIKISKASQEINSETITSKHDKEIPKERYISPEAIQK